MKPVDGHSVLLAAWLSLLPSAAGAADPPADSGGYVDDRSCAICHADLYQPYQEVGMARSFYRPGHQEVIEDFSDESHYFHAASGRHYEMRRRGDRYFFRRYLLDGEGHRIFELEQEIDWVLGSGNHARTYLYRTLSGELYQLPVAWYTETGSWGMAPGYDRVDHDGVLRRVRKECMFCHNAYPGVSKKEGNYWEPQVYPEDLPEGTGCQRCHGPAGEHVRLALHDRSDPKRLRTSITNPGRLEPRLRDAVCYECHMQPTVVLPGLRRFGQDAYAFRPGEPLSDHFVLVDVDVAGESRSERFEINHHPYRLEQSRCQQESGGKLSCLTCHDPHRKVAPEERAAHYRAACLTCHTLDACRLGEMTEDAAPAVDPGDCVACHMPKRRPSDVVHTVMTDHLIRLRPGGPELVAPRAEAEAPVLTDVELLPSEGTPEGALAEVYRAVVILRAGPSSAAADYLEKMLAVAKPESVEPYLDLAKFRIHQQRWRESEAILQWIREKFPGEGVAKPWLGLTAFQLGRSQEAVEKLRALTQAGSREREVWFNLGVVLTLEDRYAEAIPVLERAIELHPHRAPAWYYLCFDQRQLGQLEQAVESCGRALVADPTHSRAYLLQGEILSQRGERDHALRLYREGLRSAANPELIREALAEASN